MEAGESNRPSLALVSGCLRRLANTDVSQVMDHKWVEEWRGGGGGGGVVRGWRQSLCTQALDGGKGVGEGGGGVGGVVWSRTDHPAEPSA